MALSPEQIETFARDGYVVFDAALPEGAIDRVVDDLDRLVGTPGRQYREGRVQDAWRISDAIRTVAVTPTVLDALQQLYGDPPLPFQTLNFPRGTEQRAHADSIHFNSEPFGRMCGVWVALEDIGPDQGPLFYYPGSQRLPELNFPELGLTPISYRNYPAYEDAIAAQIEVHGFAPAHGLLKRGQALVWAANLLHGGSHQNDKSLGRRSQVTHYYFPRCRYWRPGASKRIRAYFEPEWIPHPRQTVRVNRLRRVLYRGMALINIPF